ncbi:MAG: hypothetical protein EOO65_02295 [Methanosarcinales archaeon]|nr:MAG: hypothetical protein EOO65_02295 [Methanosarcinales archaeon]
MQGFGGTASGPDILRQLHEDIVTTLRPLTGKPLTVTAIVDLMNQIGRCIVSGDVRQTAEIAFGNAADEEYIDLKNYAKNPYRAAFGWTRCVPCNALMIQHTLCACACGSVNANQVGERVEHACDRCVRVSVRITASSTCSNNSVYAELGMNYETIASRIAANGEPGVAWLENMRKFGRMADAPNWKDAAAKGGNPCLEQTLESFELCCLVETFPARHADLGDFLATLRVSECVRACENACA